MEMAIFIVSLQTYCRTVQSLKYMWCLITGILKIQGGMEVKFHVFITKTLDGNGNFHSFPADVL